MSWQLWNSGKIETMIINFSCSKQCFYFIPYIYCECAKHVQTYFLSHLIIFISGIVVGQRCKKWKGLGVGAVWWIVFQQNYICPPYYMNIQLSSIIIIILYFFNYICCCGQSYSRTLYECHWKQCYALTLILLIFLFWSYTLFVYQSEYCL